MVDVLRRQYGDLSLASEFWFGCLLWAAVGITQFRLGSGWIFSDVSLSNPDTFFGRLFPVSATLLGFVLASFNIILSQSTTSERFSFLRESNNLTRLFEVFTDTLKWLSILTLVSLAGALGPSKHLFVEIVLLVLPLPLIIVSLRFARCIHLLARLARVLSLPSPQPAKKAEKTQAPEPVLR